MHRPLPGVFRRVGLNEKKDEAEQDNAQIRQGHEIQSVNILIGDVAIDGDLGNVRTE